MEKIGGNTTGLYKNALKNNDFAYYYTLKINGKVKWFKVGTFKNGIRVADARKARSNKYNEINNIDVVSDNKMLGREERTIPTFEEAMQAYINFKLSSAKKTKTYNTYLGLYNTRLKNFIGDKLLDNITKEQIQAILNIHSLERSLENQSEKSDVQKKFELEAENHKKKIILAKKTKIEKGENLGSIPKIDKLSPKTLNTLLDIVRMVYDYAFKEEVYKGKNITSDMKKIPLDNARERFLKKEEIAELLDYAKNNLEDGNVYICILLALFTGARMNVVVNIKVSDINIEERTIKLIDEKTDTDKSYTGYINEKYYDIIKKQLELAKKLNSKLILTDKSTDKYRGRFYGRKLQPIFDKLFNEGIDKKDTKNRVVPHTLRHTFGSQLVINGVDIYTVQKLMHHKDLTMTMRYAKLNDQVKKDSVNKLDF